MLVWRKVLLFCLSFLSMFSLPSAILFLSRTFCSYCFMVLDNLFYVVYLYELLKPKFRSCNWVVYFQLLLCVSYLLLNSISFVSIVILFPSCLYIYLCLCLLQFIGELGKLEILSESILHRCIKQLLDKKKNRRNGSKDMAEDLECLSQIMRTCGRILDSDKGKVSVYSLFFYIVFICRGWQVSPPHYYMSC